MAERTRLLQHIGEELHRSLSTADERGAIKLIGLEIHSFPSEAVELIKDSVERLSLQNNHLVSLSSGFMRLDKLRYLDIHENEFTSFPDVLTLMNLEILDISFNKLTSLPIELGNLKKLKVLSLKNNQLETIPWVITQIKDLKILELEHNPFNQHITQFLNGIPYKPQSAEWLQEIRTFLLTNSSPLEDKSRSRSSSESMRTKRMGFMNINQEDLANVSTGTISPSLDSIPEHKSNEYFKRLSTLPELRTSMTQAKIVDIARKVLFSFSEFNTSLRKMNAFCDDKALVSDLTTHVRHSQTLINQLVDSLERQDDENLIAVVIQTTSAFKKIMEFLSTSVTQYTKNMEACFVRMLLLSLFMCHSEIYNAYTILEPQTPHTQSHTSTKQRTALPPLRIPDNNNINNNSNNGITQQQLNEFSEVDEQLYESLNTVLQASQQVYSELNDAISKSALQNARSDEYQLSSNSIQRIKELTQVLVNSMDLNKKIKVKLQPAKSLTLMDKKRFYDELNSFLKSIITILASTKAIMNESPILHEVRPSLASLTKATKDVTILLEASSYRMINDSFQSQSQPQSAMPQSAQPAMISSIPSVMSIPQMNTPFHVNGAQMNPFDSLPISETPE